MARGQFRVYFCFLGPNMAEDQSNPLEDQSIADLFESEEYVEQHVKCGQQTLRLLVSPSACSEQLCNSPWPPGACV